MIRGKIMVSKSVLKYIHIFIAFAMMLCLFAQKAEAKPSDFGERVAEFGEVTAVRIGRTDEHLRLVIDATKEIDYSTIVLSNPSRIVINLSGAWLSKDVPREQNVDSPYASRVRVAQFDKKTVRVVIETPVTKGHYDMFSLEGGSSPYRVVIDLGNVSKSDDKKSENTSDNTDNANKNNESSENDNSNVPATKPADDSNDETDTKDKQDDKNDKNNKDSDSEATYDEDDDDVSEDGINTSVLDGKKIAIDPGHGGEDSGAIGPTGIMEKTVTLRVSQEVKRLLEDAGANVIMTRETDTEVSPKHKMATDIDELQARCDVANKANADIFVSIHMDSFTSGDANGTTGYYYAKGTKKSAALAKYIQADLVKKIGTESRGVKTCNFYVVRKTNMPATLIEVAFISNQKEEKLLNSSKGVKNAAAGIVAGIADFFSNGK